MGLSEAELLQAAQAAVILRRCLGACGAFRLRSGLSADHVSCTKKDDPVPSRIRFFFFISISEVCLFV